MHVCVHIQKINFLLQTLRYYIKSTSLLLRVQKKIHISLRSVLQNTHHIVTLFYRVMFTTGIGGIERQ